MKNLFIALGVVIAAGFTPANATAIHVDPKAEKEFEKNFAGAMNVKWTHLSEGYLKVSFTLNGVRAESYFDANAELLGSVRNIFYNQLPLPVIQSLGNRFTNAVVTGITEISNGEGVSYRVILEKEDRKYNLRISSRGSIMEQQKIKLKK